MIQTGWPEQKQEPPAVLAPYFSFVGWDECLWQSCLQQLTHWCKRLLKRGRECNTMYWPGMTAELKEYISMWHMQQIWGETIERVVAEPWNFRLTLRESWYRSVHHWWLRVPNCWLDYFSNFWVIDHLHDMKASTVIKKLKCHFAKHGIPDIVIRDRGLQFACKKFSSFANEWDKRRQMARQKQLLKRCNAFYKKLKKPRETY